MRERATPLHGSFRALLWSACLLVALVSPRVAGAAGPTIDVWYGDPQTFGVPGNPQRWVNVLGNVSDPEGVASLTYSLNGGPAQALSIGPDTRRLDEPGDFNVEIDYADLVSGANRVTLTATDGVGDVTVRDVTVNYVAGNTWPATTVVDWSAAADVTDAAQVVDGLWHLEAGGLRPDVMAYDRPVAIGDETWTDYEVLVPVTINDREDPCCPFPSIAPGLGLTLRWLGHTPLDPPEQPNAYWEPQGASPWLDYSVGGEGRFQIGGNNGLFVVDETGLVMPEGVTHLWRARVETLPDGRNWYAFKVWPQGQAEPVNWLLEGEEGVADVDSGSLLLVAHHVDATFGNVEVLALADDVDPPAVTDVETEVGDEFAVVRWRTTEPSRTQLEWGPDAGYGQQVIGDVYDTEHRVLLTNLAPGSTVHYRIGAGDQRGNATQTGDLTLATLPAGSPSDLDYEGFNDPQLDPGRWTFVNPAGDGTLALTGAAAEIAVPDGSQHGVWTNGNSLPRLVAPLADGDFEVEVKLDSPLDSDFQGQGFLIQESSTRVVRVEFHHNLGQTRVFAATILDATADIKLLQNLPALAPPMYLRLRREGDLWTVFHSRNGLNWTEAASFVQPLAVSSLALYAGNTDVAHTAAFDHVLVSSPQQATGEASLDVSVVGDGSVVLDPDQPTYQIGDPVELTAVPGPSSTFSGWSGDLTGTANPTVLTLAATNQVTATFSGQDVTPPVISNVQVATTQTSAGITWTTDEPASSVLDWGLDAGYGNVVSQPTLATQHEVQLTGLDADTDHHFRIQVQDGSGNPASTGDLTFRTEAFAGSQVPESDDFGDGVIDPARWTLVDPVGGATATALGTTAQIALPNDGSPHEPWTAGALVPRLRQAVDDVDFEVEVKFDSPLPGATIQGLLVEQDDQDFVRAEFHRLSGQTRVFVASLFGGEATIHALENMPLPEPMWLRVTRSGDLFTVAWSLDGQNFTTAATFEQPMTVAGVSVFAGTSEPQAVSVVADYFFETGSPIVPEDGYPVTVTLVGSGSVTRSPDKPNFRPGETVELTAVPAAGQMFEGWGGDASGSANPLELTVNGPLDIEARFAADTTPPVIGNVVTLFQKDGRVSVAWGTNEPADSRVDWGPSSAYGNQVTDPALTTDHQLWLEGVEPGVTTHFRIASTDEAGNTGFSSNLTFVYQPPSGSCGLLGIELLVAWPALRRWRRRRTTPAA